MVVEFGKNYWDLGFAMLGGSLINQYQLEPMDFFGNYDVLTGVGVTIASAISPVYLNQDTGEAATHRTQRNMAASMFMGMLGNETQNFPAEAFVAGALICGAFCLGNEYFRLEERQSSQNSRT